MGMRFSAPVQTDLGVHPVSCTMSTGAFPGVKSGRGVTLTPHRLLAQWSRKSRAVPLLPLWAVRPVQSLSACTTVHFTLFKNKFSVLSPWLALLLLCQLNNNDSNNNNNNNNSFKRDRVYAQLHFNICKKTGVQLDKKH